MQVAKAQGYKGSGMAKILLFCGPGSHLTWPGLWNLFLLIGLENWLMRLEVAFELSTAMSQKTIFLPVGKV